MCDIEKEYISAETLLAEKEYPVIDLRSDTLTKPTLKMRQAMQDAIVGDDVYGEDPTVTKLEITAATLMGKEAALFVTSGTMGNLIAIMVHCNERGSELYCGEESHVFLHEQVGAAQLAGVNMCTLPNDPDGSFDLTKLMSKLRKDRIHEPISKLVMVENTINGKVVPQKWIDRLAEMAREKDLKLHLDGARIWNAAVASDKPVKDLVSPFDSVTFCLSKGLGAPIGSLLCGSTFFVNKARRVRKVLGGGMRQVGIIAAAGLVALEEIVPLLRFDHERAARIAREINLLNSSIFSVNEALVQTNMIFVNIRSNSVSSVDFARRLRMVRDDTKDDRVVIKCLALTDTTVRLVMYHAIDDEMMDVILRKLRHVIKTMENSSM